MADQPEAAQPPYEPPNLPAFIVEAPLYKSCDLRLSARGPFVAGKDPLPGKMPTLDLLICPMFPIDAYCPGCKQGTIYRAVQISSEDRTKFATQFLTAGSRTLEVKLYCSRIAQHELIAVMHVRTLNYDYRVQSHDRKVVVTKIGMLPALADLQQSLNSRFAKVLGDKGVAEFKRAVGLASHGIGIGAFVYLRRIFEDLIDEVAQAAFAAGKVAKEDYYRSRMDEKIGLLKGRLPAFMVEHKQWYSIVSKGIHELGEDECLEYFPVVRNGIEIILDQKAEAFDRAQREKDAGLAIQKISQKVAKTSAVEPVKESV